MCSEGGEIVDLTTIIVIADVALVAVYPKVRGMVPTAAQPILDTACLMLHKTLTTLALVLAGFVFGLWADAEAAASIAALRAKVKAWAFTVTPTPTPTPPAPPANGGAT
jgi:hypothetical protein